MLCIFSHNKKSWEKCFDYVLYARYNLRLTRMNKNENPSNFLLSNGGHDIEQNIGVGNYKGTSIVFILCQDLKASSSPGENFSQPVLPIV